MTVALAFAAAAARTALRLALVLAPLFLLGFAAGAVRALARRPGIPPRRRRALSAAWVLILLAGGPLWLVAAALGGLL